MIDYGTYRIEQERCANVRSSLSQASVGQCEHQTKIILRAFVQPAAVHVLTIVVEVAGTTTYRRPKGKSRSASSDVILITMRAPRAFSAVGRSTG